VDRIASLRQSSSGRAPMVAVGLESGEAIRVHVRRLDCPWVAVGQSVDAGRVASLRMWAAADAAEQRALRLTGSRGRSRAELRARMAAWGVDAASAEEVLDRLAACGAVNDAALAESVVSSRRRTGHGRLRIRADLERLVVDPEVSGVALGDEAGDEGELTRASRELDRRYGGRPTDRRDLARAAGHLARRGFDAETVNAALGLDVLD
jgi:SOS response regulatory protein OraA/RecX